MKRWFIALTAIDFFIEYLRWAEKRMNPIKKPFWWPWVIYHVISGYPPGELHHWDDYPKWLKKHDKWLVPLLASKGDSEDESALREWWATYG